MIFQMELKTNNLVSDIMYRSQLETARIADVDLRYLATAGTDKLSQIHQSLMDADAALRGGPLKRFFTLDLTEPDVPMCDDLIAPTSLFYTLNLTMRHHEGVEQAIAMASHTYLVDAALASFYTSVAQADLAQVHTELVASDDMKLQRLLYIKLPPAL